MIPVFIPKRTAELDKLAIEGYGIDGRVLMELAGYNSAKFILAHTNVYEFLIFCGGGNNAGDGLVVAKHLTNHGKKVHIFLIKPPEQLVNENKYNFEIINKLQINYQVFSMNDIEKIKLEFKDKDIEIIDAIFGTGFHGVPREPYFSAINLINELDKTVYSIDIPSGLNGETGQVEAISVKAKYTLFMAYPKTGFFQGEGIDISGEVIQMDIGIPEILAQQLEESAYILEEKDIRHLLPMHEKSTYKNKRGHLAIIAGSSLYPGAGYLTANAGIHSGAGLVTLFSSHHYDYLPPEIIRRTLPTCNEEIAPFISNLSEYDAIVIGPGLDKNDVITIDIVKNVLSNIEKPILIDASALYILKENNLKFKQPKNIILTPHFGEFAYLTGKSIKDIKYNKFNLAKEFIDSTGTNLLLKGAYSIFATHNKKIFINPFANNTLAKAGSGDVLSGIIGGLLVQNMNIANATKLGMWLHARAGIIAGNRKTHFSATANDFIENLGDAFSALCEYC